MLPRLEASDMLRAIRGQQLAQPVSGGDELQLQTALAERQAVLDRLQACADGRDPDEVGLNAEPVTPADLAGMGIGLVMEPDNG